MKCALRDSRKTCIEGRNVAAILSVLWRGCSKWSKRHELIFLEGIAMINLRNSVVVLTPAPLFLEGWRGSTRLANVHWRVTEQSERRIVIQTESSALGLCLTLPIESLRFQPKDLRRHPSVTQGVLRLEDQWEIPPVGSCPSCKRVVA